MARYIDADALLNKIWNGNSDSIVLRGYAADLVKAMPTADVVEVVRCKDCISFNGDTCTYHSDYYGEHEVNVDADDYCSYGRRTW